MRESRGVWVSISAVHGHMTRGSGLKFDDSPLQASESMAPPAGNLLLVHPVGRRNVSYALNSLVVFLLFE